MTNRSKDKGTKAEQDVVKWFHEQGETQVERRALYGAHDRGDLVGLPSMVVSVKMRTGVEPKLELSAWLRDLDAMQHNAVTVPDEPLPSGLLVIRRRMYPDPGDWYAVQTLGSWWELYRELLT